MTKEEFEQEMLEWVLYYSQKLEVLNLRSAILPNEYSSNKITYNPFLQFDNKCFNKKILANLQGLEQVVRSHPEISSSQIGLMIMGNPKFKVLNQIFNYNKYFIAELKSNINTAMDIAIHYARHCEKCDKLNNK